MSVGKKSKKIGGGGGGHIGLKICVKMTACKGYNFQNGGEVISNKRQVSLNAIDKLITNPVE